MKKNRYTISPEIRKKIKQLEIHTRRLLRGAQVGDSRSAIKGTGFEFDQIRNYQVGDDVRFIDWKASTRMNTLLVKQYIEERSRTIILALDVSQSGNFGSKYNVKRDTLAQAASVLALVANSGKDRVGLMLFSDIIEVYIPPSQGLHHVQQLVEYAFSYVPQRKKTNIMTVFKKFAELKYRDMMGFIVSDFIDSHIEPAYLAPIGKKYEMVAIRCLDNLEQELPPLGFIPMQDPETGEHIIVDLRHGKQPKIAHFLSHRLDTQNKLYKRHNIKVFDIANNDNFISDLVKFFRRQMQY